jgi:hypothetical protein
VWNAALRPVLTISIATTDATAIRGEQAVFESR